MGKPGGRLHVPPAPKTEEQELDEFVQEFWETYQAHRTEYGPASRAPPPIVSVRLEQRVRGRSVTFAMTGRSSTE